MLNVLTVIKTAAVVLLYITVPQLRQSRAFYDTISSISRQHPELKIQVPDEFVPMFGDIERQQKFNAQGRPFGLVEDSISNNNSMTLAYLGTQPRLFLHEYDLAHRLLSNKLSNRVTIDRFRKARVNKMFPSSMIASEGRSWIGHRAVLKPAFDMTKAYAQVFPIITKEYLNQVVAKSDANPSENGEPSDIDFKELFKVLALRVIGKYGFGTEFDSEEHCRQIADANTDMFRSVAGFMNNPWNQLPGLSWLPTHDNLKATAAAKKCETIAERLVQARRENATESSFSKDDFADRLVNSGLSEEQITDDVKLLIVAGHETTAYLLTWVMVVFAEYPEIYKRCRDEARSILDETSDRMPTEQNIKEMPYLEATIIETLRKYPPIPIIEREVMDEFDVGNGVKLPAGTGFTVHVWGIHHRPDYWPEPATIRPERHFVKDPATGNVKTMMPTRNFISFSEGPRQCPGRKFALLEAKQVLSLLLTQFDLEFKAGQQFVTQLGLTISPKDGVLGRIIPRSD